MNLTKDQKKQKSQDLASEITASGTLFFTAYQGLKFVDMAELRAQLAPTGAKFRVERNAIVDHAIRQAKIEGADEKLFQGPTAIAVGGDIAAVAKTLVDFQKKFAALKLRACYSDGVCGRRVVQRGGAVRASAASSDTGFCLRYQSRGRQTKRQIITADGFTVRSCFGLRSNFFWAGA